MRIGCSMRGVKGAHTMVCSDRVNKQFSLVIVSIFQNLQKTFTKKPWESDLEKPLAAETL